MDDITLLLMVVGALLSEVGLVGGGALLVVPGVTLLLVLGPLDRVALSLEGVGTLLLVFGMELGLVLVSTFLFVGDCTEWSLDSLVFSFLLWVVHPSAPQVTLVPASWASKACSQERN